MKKLKLFIVTFVGGFLLFTSVVNAKTNSIANSFPDYAKILSVCAIVFGVFAIIGGMYIMFLDPKKKSKKKGGKKK